MMIVLVFLGPYIFGGGLITFLLSKEIWIVEHGFTHFLAFWLAFYIIAKKYGKGIGNYLDKTADVGDIFYWLFITSSPAQSTCVLVQQNNPSSENAPSVQVSYGSLQ